MMLLQLLRSLLLVLTVAVGFHLTKWIFTKYRKWKLLQRIPMPPRSSRVSGHMSVFLEKQGFRKLGEWANTLGPIYRLHIFHLDFIIVSDSSLFLPLLQNGYGALDKFAAFYEPLNGFSEHNLPNILTAKHSSYWKTVRRAIAPIFSVGNMKRLFPSLARYCSTLVAYLKSLPEGSQVNMEDVARRVTSQIIDSLMTGEDLGSFNREEDPTLQLMTDISQAMANYASDPLLKLKLWSPKLRWSKEKLRIQHQVSKELIKRIEASNVSPTSIAACLLSARDVVTGKPLTPEQFAAEVGIIQAAGFETSAYSLVWTLYQVAVNPQVEEKLVAELDQKGLLVKPGQSQPKSELTWQVLGELPYLNAVIKESLRLLPPAALGTNRQLKEEVQLGDYLVPAGVGVMMSPYAHAHSKHNFGAHADDFIPERWLMPHASGRGNKGDESMDPVTLGGAGSLSMSDVYTFSAGPRDCVGQVLAKFELQVVLASLWSHFHFDLHPEMGGKVGIENAMALRLTLQSDKGMKMVCWPRGRMSSKVCG